MILHKDSRFFGYAIRAASDYLKINEEFIEKDYWITFVLRCLSKSRHADKAVFKGGTSLSKAYGLINRFSEDVDIAVIAESGKSGNEIKNIILKIS
jgi:predicted nucleotidyltransferase component of viral defense system